MQKNNNYDNQYALIMGDNVNVGSSSDLKDFFILIGWIVLVVIVFLLSFQLIANCLIDNMSHENQVKLEKLLETKNRPPVPDEYRETVKKLYKIERNIINLDPSLKRKEIFPIYVSECKQINAWVHPDGTIFFTKGMLDENMPEQELAFVLAHEIGHYAHRDHLKSISKQIAIIALCIISGNKTELASVVKAVTNIDSIRHSKKQEKQADLYAGDILIKIYGTNQGGIDAMKRIQAHEKYPELLQYISDHPLTTDRIYLLKKQQKKLLKK